MMMKLGFIGGGNMAEALILGLFEKKLFKPSDVLVSDIATARRRRLGRGLGIATTVDNLLPVAKASAIVLAVKPQQIDAVLSEIASAFAPESGAAFAPESRAPFAPESRAPFAPESRAAFAPESSAASAVSRAAGAPQGRKAIKPRDRLFISIAAGVTLSRLQDALGHDARLIRVMPNAPAMVGRGMAAIVRSRGASKADESFALKIFRAVGDAVTLKDESMLDAVTALSGSGPAYVYLFIKALADAGASQGLPADLALRMALKTVEGAVYNMRMSKLTPEELIRIVASPGGTTEAALKRFAAANFSDIVADAVKAAADRSRELGRSN